MHRVDVLYALMDEVAPKTKPKPLWISEDLHTRLKILAARLGQPLGKMAEEKLEELVSTPEIKALNLHPNASAH